VSIQRGFVGTPLQPGQEIPGREEKAMKLIVERGADLVQNLNVMSNEVREMIDGIKRGRGSLGKLLVDEAAYRSLTHSLNKIERKGTLGKLATDETLFNEWRDVGANLESATAKLNSNQTTAGKFFTDPQFYDNLTGLAGDLRLLVGDFRQNPKKFLRVKFSIF